MLRNVTITLPEDVLREARHLAVDRGMSLSRYLAQLLEEQVRSSGEYREARERELARMQRGLNLGTGGNVPWTRDELHER